MARTTLTRRSVLGTAVIAAAAPAVLAIPGSARAASVARITVAAGQTYVVEQTTRAGVLTIAEGGTIAAPSGYSLTLTVDGVETGGVLTATGGTDTVIAAGTYRGDVVLTVATANPIAWQGLTYPFRQALYVDSTGLVKASSVLAAVVGGRVGDASATGVEICSTGQCFDAFYMPGGSYTLERPRIALLGNGRCDFVGYGAAVTATGTGTRLVVDGAQISNKGAVRTGVISDNGATVVVKNSTISTRNGVLPDDYQATVNLEYMESAPWMLAISGNVRATNLLGNNSIAGYVNSRITSETWGVLSTDSGSDCQLASINSTVTNTGANGYGSYVIGNATEWFLGTTFDVGSYATIFTGGTASYGDSTKAAVASINSSLGLGLTDRELAAIPVRPTVINSKHWGFMWHGAGTLGISGGTVVNSKLTTFLNKGQQVAITVDGSQGAELYPGNGVLVQVMENDDPGPVVVDGVLLNAGVYTEPTGTPTKVDSFDVTVVNSTDAVHTFSSISLKGDFYNAIRGGAVTAAGPGGAGSPGGLNMVLAFDNSRVEGVISASASQHAVSTISAANYWQLGEVSNTVQAVINNGVIVTLSNGSEWAVTGTSYLSKLVLDADSKVVSRHGGGVTMTVDGVTTAIAAGGSYSGAIILTVS